MKLIKNAFILITTTIPYMHSSQTELTQQEPLTNAILQDGNKVDVVKSELQEWNDHIQSLLEKGVFWDFGNSVPTNTWKNKALTIAQKHIEQNSSLADLVKQSFTTTINEKITLENGAHTSFTTALITEFNNYIDQLLTKAAEPTEVLVPAETQEQVVIEEVPQETTPIIEEVPSQALAQTETSQEPQAEQEWLNYLKDMTNNDYDYRSIKNFLEKAHELAQKNIVTSSIDRQSTTITNVKNQFKEAVEEHAKTKGFGGLNVEDIISSFNSKLDENISKSMEQQEVVQSKQLSPDESVTPKEQPISAAPSKQPVPGLSKDSFTKPLPTDFQAKVPLQESMQQADSIISDYTITVPYYTPSSEPAIVQKEQQEIEQQKGLKKALVEEIQKKAQSDAEKKSKQTIIASLMEKIFNVDIDEWFKPSKKEPEIQTIPDIVEQVLSSEKDIEQKNLKKTAYLQFQKTLLSFNAKEFWDHKKNRPLQSWVNAIRSQLTMLIDYHMITLAQALEIIEETLAIDSRIAELDRKAVKEAIKEFVIKIKENGNEIL